MISKTILSFSVIFIASNAIQCAKTFKKSEICPCLPLNICPEVNRFSKKDAKYFATVLKCTETGFIRCCKNNGNSANIRRSDDVENIILIDDVSSTSEDQFEIKSNIDEITTAEVNEVSPHDVGLKGLESDLEDYRGLVKDVEELKTDLKASKDDLQDRSEEDEELSTENSKKVISDQNEFDKDSKRSTDFEEFPKASESLSTFLEFPTTSESPDDLIFTTDSSSSSDLPKNIDVKTEINVIEETSEAAEALREPKFIDNDISVIYPNHKYSELDKKKKDLMLEHLFLIFPNGEIEAALATSTTRPQTTLEKPRRVIVRKRLIKRPMDSLEGAESKMSQTVIEPKEMDVEEVKKRLSDMHRRKIDVQTTTEDSIDETTTRKQRRKKIKIRKRKESTTAAILSTTLPTFKPRETTEESTNKPRRKIVYDTRSRVNFLKQRPSSQAIDEESIEAEVATNTIQTPAAETTENIELFTTTPTIPLVVKQAPRIDFEHKKIIEALVKTLTAINSGVDTNFVERMIETHKSKMKEIRKSPPTLTTVRTMTAEPTRPFRGSAKFQKPITTIPSQPETEPETKGTRTRNLSRTRNTIATEPTQRSTVKKSPRTVVTQKTANSIINLDSLPEEVDMPPKQKAPLDFRPSALYGITMDQFNDFDSDTIEKIHATMKSPSNVQTGFFPVIQNGTPSTLL